MTSGSTETARLRPGARSSQTDLTTINGDVLMTTVADSDVTHRSESVYNGSSHQSWRRIVLLIIAITVHNIPGDYIQLFITFGLRHDGTIDSSNS